MFAMDTVLPFESYKLSRIKSKYLVTKLFSVEGPLCYIAYMDEVGN